MIFSNTLCRFSSESSVPIQPFSFSNIAITSGCVGVNLIPRFNILITFFAFRSISLAVCSLVSITRFPGFFLFLHNPPVFINTAGQRYHPVYPGTCIFKTIIMRSASCLISFEIRVWHIFKKSVLNNIKTCFLHLPVLITEKSLALRRRTILSTRPFIYRVSVSGKLSTRPFIYHISVSGKLSLYLYSNKRKEGSQ